MCRIVVPACSASRRDTNSIALLSSRHSNEGKPLGARSLREPGVLGTRYIPPSGLTQSPPNSGERQLASLECGSLDSR